jgi:hypothetical protein
VETPDELSSYTVDTSDQHVQPVLHG